MLQVEMKTLEIVCLNDKDCNQNNILLFMKKLFFRIIEYHNRIGKVRISPWMNQLFLVSVYVDKIRGWITGNFCKLIEFSIFWRSLILNRTLMKHYDRKGIILGLYSRIVVNAFQSICQFCPVQFSAILLMSLEYLAIRIFMKLIIDYFPSFIFLMVRIEYC